MLKAGIPQSFATGLAAYVAARDLAADHLRLGQNVVVDAVNGVEAAREMWRTLATECHAALSFVMITCSDGNEHRRRVEARADPTPPLRSPTWSEVVEREFVPWDDPVLLIDSLAPPGESVARILNYLSG
jgi:predicted kinase